ncbi:efflux RND transporter permease subunit [Eisenibacter elegans]|uniref:efflux RND transporter permease subunit n=1 Tax=Eisenibacter elegans TaxID=997 RepID=UPI000407AAF1|nr:efflux RND transporter permease subunit [Eisenibacter elegans]
MVDTFIKRPILSLVISLFFVLLGLLALITLPVTQFPDIAPPSVTVTAKYNGANAEVAMKAVATTLERAINGVPGMTYMTTVVSNNGVTLIQVYFQVGTDPDVAAVSVQNRVATVIDELPEEVIRAGVSTEKEVNSMLMYLNITHEDTTVDEKFIYNFTDINILQELKRIDGVGFCEILGSREYAIRVWLKPDRLVAYKLDAEEVIAAIRAQNIEAAPGKTGESSARAPQIKEYVLKYTGKLTKPEEYANIVIRADEDGSILRLKDVAEIELGSVTYNMMSETDGQPSASIMIKQRPGSNASEVIQNVKDRMAELKATKFPAGVDYSLSYDVSRFLDASIHEVIKTLIEAFLLVFLVVFIFLQDIRATVISALAVPVALIGTLACMQLMGFSINMLTLFALVLAIGIVVDNAIVVVEAVHATMLTRHVSAYEATFIAMREITAAIIAITLVMSAVFVPVAFLSGPVGVFYRQFSLTLAFAIVISGINALTLAPALCALWMKNTHGEPPKRNLLARFLRGFDRQYMKVENGYRQTVIQLAGRKLVTALVLVAFVVGTGLMSQILPTGFIPNEDQGMIYVDVVSPAGATLERSAETLRKIQQVAAQLEEVESVSTLAGFSLLTEANGASYGMGMINLKPWDERELTDEALMQVLREKTKDLGEANIEYFAPPAVPGFGNAGGFELRLTDQTGLLDLNKTAEVTQQFLEALRKRKEIAGAFTSFDASFPQYLIHLDPALVAKKGLTVEKAMDNLQVLIGSFYATNFVRFGQMYKVMLQASPEYRLKPEDLMQLYVKNNQGEMVSYATFARMERVYGPEQITRYNMYVAAMINGDAAKGYSSGEAIKAVEAVAKEVLPKGYSIEWSGMTREEILSGNQTIYIFAICLLFVYLILAAQYESFALPMAVLLSLPVGVFGTYFFLQITGLQNNIYAQVALVMLIGLLGKNAILIVEFAMQQQQKKQISAFEAAVEGATLRLRPILMTSFAFIAGMIPLCLASGAGALGNKSIGVAAAGGMLIGTVIGVFLIPGLYVIFAELGKKRNASAADIVPETTLTETNA